MLSMEILLIACQSLSIWTVCILSSVCFLMDLIPFLCQLFVPTKCAFLSFQLLTAPITKIFSDKNVRTHNVLASVQNIVMSYTTKRMDALTDVFKNKHCQGLYVGQRSLTSDDIVPDSFNPSRYHLALLSW